MLKSILELAFLIAGMVMVSFALLHLVNGWATMLFLGLWCLSIFYKDAIVLVFKRS